MAKRTIVGVRDLKNNLSAFLRDVRGGATVTVSDRGRPVAELRPHAGTARGRAAELAAGWARDGRLALPTARKHPLEPSPVGLKPGTSRRLLDADRSEA